MPSSFGQEVRKLWRFWYWKLSISPRRSVVNQIKTSKKERKLTGRAFEDAPTVSLIVHSFNQVRNIKRLKSGLRLTCADELIVCEDGSIDGSHEEWIRNLDRPNDFLIRSNDIHEIRAYDRAIGYARGEFICLMQDDDRPPKDGSWLAKALAVFAHYPKLAVLGGWCGFNSYFSEEYNAPWLPSPQGRIPCLDPHTGLLLLFVENVNIGPYVLRKSIYNALQGFDLRFSAPGEPGITFESEFCYRAWREGYQVALTDIPVKMERGNGAHVFPGGTSLWGKEERERNELQNKKRIAALYEDDLPAIQQKVSEANSQLVGRGD